MADAAGDHLDQDLVGVDGGNVQFLKRERLAKFMDNSGFHLA